jgi:hypothetical protein
VELFDAHGVRATLIDPTLATISAVKRVIEEDVDKIFHKSVAEQDAENAAAQRAEAAEQAEAEKNNDSPPAASSASTGTASVRPGDPVVPPSV